MATAAFWRTFPHDGKISPGWWGWGGARPPLYNIVTIKYKVSVYAPAEWGRYTNPVCTYLYQYMYSVVSPIQHYISCKLSLLYAGAIGEPISLNCFHPWVNYTKSWHTSSPGWTPLSIVLASVFCGHAWRPPPFPPPPRSSLGLLECQQLNPWNKEL